MGRYWGLDPGTSNFFALPNIDPDIAPHTSATSYTGVIPTSEAARAVDVIPAMPGFSDVPTISQITVSPESSELIKSGRGASATAAASSAATAQATSIAMAIALGLILTPFLN